jgi:hypothetical protein
MTMRLALRFVAVVVAGLPALEGPVLAQSPDPRADLEAVAQALDAAVSKVSHPLGWAFAPAGESALSYRVAGFGAIFVVAPRALSERSAAPPTEGGAVLPRVMRVVEQTLQSAESAETRQRLRRVLEGLQRQEQELASHAAAEENGRAAIQKLTEERMARRARDAAQGVPVDRRQRVEDAAAAEAAVRSFEADAAAFQREAEAARQAADEALSEVAREMKRRLAGPGAATPAAPDSLAGPAEPPAGSALFVPPPWRSWGGAAAPPREERPAETVVAEVREAVTRVLEAHGGALHVLSPQEIVLVTVDFVPQGGMLVHVRPQRTLVVRVRKLELEQRAAGSLDAGALRSRIDYTEY